jgi:hypothetical protein
MDKTCSVDEIVVEESGLGDDDLGLVGEDSADATKFCTDANGLLDLE